MISLFGVIVFNNPDYFITTLHAATPDPESNSDFESSNTTVIESGVNRQRLLIEYRAARERSVRESRVEDLQGYVSRSDIPKGKLLLPRWLNAQHIFANRKDLPKINESLRSISPTPSMEELRLQQIRNNPWINMAIQRSSADRVHHFSRTITINDVMGQIAVQKGWELMPNDLNRSNRNAAERIYITRLSSLHRESLSSVYYNLFKDSENVPLGMSNMKHVEMLAGYRAQFINTETRRLDHWAYDSRIPLLHVLIAIQDKQS